MGKSWCYRVAIIYDFIYINYYFIDWETAFAFQEHTV